MAQPKYVPWPVSLVKGAAMGVVELIPGVSAGTVALATGIYPRLVAAINAVVTLAATVFQLGGRSRGRWVQTASAVPWRFLVPLLAGMAGAVLAFSHVVEGMIDRYPAQCLAFFTGVVLASAVVSWGQMPRRGVAELVAAAVATVAGFLVMGLQPPAGASGAAPWFLAVAGALGVSVMMLPGVSGSFVLLLLGVYQQVVGYVRGLTTGALGEVVGPLAIFGLGMVVGLVVVARLLGVLLKRQRSVTLAALSGLMVASVRRLWPFIDSAAGADVALDRLPKLGLGEVGTLGAGTVAVILGLIGAGVALILVQARLAPSGSGVDQD